MTDSKKTSDASNSSKTSADMVFLDHALDVFEDKIEEAKDILKILELTTLKVRKIYLLLDELENFSKDFPGIGLDARITFSKQIELHAKQLIAQTNKAIGD